MPLAQQSLRDYLELLASKSHVPGGGAAAAVTGAQAAALLAMVGNLTVGKAKFKAVEVEVRRFIDQLEGIRDSLLALVQKDANGFDRVMLAYKKPEQYNLQKALLGAAAAPLAMMQEIASLKPIADRLAEVGNPNLLSDVKVAVHLIRAGIASAQENVMVNAMALTDEAEKNKLLAQAESFN